MHKECKDEILKIIDEKIKPHEYRLKDITNDIDVGYCRALQELKETLSRNDQLIIGKCAVCGIDIYENDTSFTPVGSNEKFCVVCWRKRNE